jgi:hypothetical protein
MSMPDLPTAGQEPWDAALNAYLSALEARVTLLESTPSNRAYFYTYASNTSAPPASGQLRMDSTDRTSVTRLWFHDVTAEGVDVSAMWAVLAAGTVDDFYIQDKDDSTKWVRYHSLADPVDMGTYTECQVSFVNDGGIALSHQQVGVVITEI